VSVARLALGTAQFGLAYGITNREGKLSPDEVTAVLSSARDAGVTTVDTAVAYGDAEEQLGKHDLSVFSVVTKLPPYDGTTPASSWVDLHLRDSRARLGVAPAALLLHRSSDLLGRNGREIAEALHRAQADGLTGGIGVSVYAPSDLDAVAGRLRWTDVQLPYNVCDRRMAQSGWLTRLANAGVRIHARSVFLQGLLLQPSEELPLAFSAWRPLWSRWHRWLAEQRQSALTACLGFALASPEIHRVVVGVGSLAHWHELMSKSTELPVVVPSWMYVDDLALIDPTRWARAS
jgi:aryl-alcohol dehydrogenase-like predicted oxidoreductase